MGGRKARSECNHFKAPLYWMGKVLDNFVYVILLLPKPNYLHFAF